MRRKPSGQGSYGNNNGGSGGGGGGGGNNGGQQRKQRFQGGGGGGNGGGHNQNRPRKNYTASREKYLLQARDALAQGDRVLAENYFQHADHCYRMMVEEGYNTRNNFNAQNNQQSGDQQGNEPQAENNGNQQNDNGPAEEMMTDNVTQLPAFLTATISDNDDRKDNVAAQGGWEE